MGITFAPPNYIFKDRLRPGMTVIDVGCADDPDFSLFVIRSFNVKAFAVDPTRKHFAALARLASVHQQDFTHLPLAIANECGQLQFHESAENASGSLLDTHVNVTNDTTTSYEVEAVTIPVLLQRIGVDSVAFLKLDLEGIEYRLLEGMGADDLNGIDQLFVEFHHHCIPEFSVHDTKRLVGKVSNFGYEFFSLDDHNYLFWKDA